jgi:hypothetical protein
MMRSNLGWCTHDDLHAGVGSIILPCPLLAIHVTEAVGVLFVELVMRDNLRELTLPEHERLFEFHSLH